MKLTDLLGAALSGLAQQKLRTALTLLGVTLGSLLLFGSLSGGIGVLDAVQERLAVGGRLLEIQVGTGFRTEKSVEAAAAKLPPGISADRLQRLAEQAQGQVVEAKFTIERAHEMKSLSHVVDVFPIIDWHCRADLEGDEQRLIDKPPPKKGRHWSKHRSRAAAVALKDHDFSQVIVCGRDLAAEGEIIVNEALLYARELYTDSDVENVLGKHIVFRSNLRSASDGPEELRELLRVKEELVAAQPLGSAARRVLEREIADLQKSVQRREKQGPPSRSAPFRVVGVFRRSTRAENRKHPQLWTSHLDLVTPSESGMRWWRTLSGSDVAIHARVKVDATESVAPVQAAIEEFGYEARSLAEIATRIRGAVLMITAVITGIAGGAFLIAALGMTNTMVMNVLERRREIGITKAIGARDRDIMWIFLLEGMLVGLAGGLLGLVFGWVITSGSSGYIRAFLEARTNEPFEGTLFAYPVWLIIGTPVLAGFVTTIASVIPARRAARLDPVATLRTL